MVGIAVSRYFEDDGKAIIRCFCKALEDANLHQVATQIKQNYVRAGKPDGVEEEPTGPYHPENVGQQTKG